MAQSQNLYQPLLFSIAYNMLGEVEEAKDAVQDVLLKYHEHNRENIKDQKSYLVKSTINHCITKYKKLKENRLEYPGEWLPEPVTERSGYSSEDHGILEMGILKILENLNPMERAVYILRELLNYEYVSIAGFTGQSESYCRQLLKRGKEKLGKKLSSQSSDQQYYQQYLNAFIKAVEEGNTDNLKKIFKEDIALYSDGGGKAAAARKPLLSSDTVVKFLLGIRSQAKAPSYKEISINGKPGIVVYENGRLNSLITLDSDEEGIKNIYIIRNPDKLKIPENY